MSVLLIRLAGPMQSWGTRSRFYHRDTEKEPSKSGVIGLLCAALGRGRDESIEDLTALKMGVRVDKEGVMRMDFQTAGGGKWKGEHYGVAKAGGAKPDTVISPRYYLADAMFTVGLKGEAGLLQTLDSAINNPIWPLYLGRKSHVPDPIRTCVVDEALDTALAQHRWEDTPDEGNLRIVIECDRDNGEVRWDVPVSFAHRVFGIRYVKHDFIPPPLKKEVPCTSQN